MTTPKYIEFSARISICDRVLEPQVLPVQRISGLDRCTLQGHELSFRHHVNSRDGINIETVHELRCLNLHSESPWKQELVI
ncbi:hypothetical protein DSO57_1029203 [Entomophthora muscae]|uniref:Uncharacterized protein n=1 Tax=Entomophthora muscae TaxID=34485 RepID=A0ACC2SQA2_9FUNG|nr:hypothetical protein DSO57_1029203 [Entomophthora muscae]